MGLTDSDALDLGPRAPNSWTGVIGGACSGSGAGNVTGSGCAGQAEISTSKLKELTSFKWAANSLRAARPRSVDGDCMTAT